MKKFVTTALAIVALVSAGSALAATGGAITPLPPDTARTYIRELGFKNQTYKLPSGLSLVKATNVVRNYASGAFTVILTLDNGAEWSYTPPVPGSGDTSMFFASAAGNCSYSNGAVTVSTTTLSVVINPDPAGCVATGVLSVLFTPNGVGALTVMDKTPVLGGTGTIGLTVTVNDGPSGTLLDDGLPGVSSLLVSNWAVSSKLSTAGTAKIDLNPATVADARKLFVVENHNTTKKNGNAVVTSTNSIDYLLPASGIVGPYAPIAADDVVRVTIAGTSTLDFTGVTKVYYGITPTSATVDPLLNTITFDVPQATAAVNSTTNIIIEVGGTVLLTPRSFNTTLALRTTDGTTTNSNPIMASTLSNTWAYSGVQLVAPWVNGNNGTFNSRFYLSVIGSTADAAVVLYRVLEAKHAGTTAVITDYTLLPVTINTTGARIVYLEDLISLPYTGGEGNGNLAVEFLVGANYAQGMASVYNKVIPGGPVNVGSYQMPGSVTPFH